MTTHDHRTDQLPEALSRALPLLNDVARPLDSRQGYLDLLGPGWNPDTGADSADNADTEGNGNIIRLRLQRLWESGIGSVLYDQYQAVARRRLGSLWRVPMAPLRLREGDIALDVACGPGEVTATLGRSVGAEGLALGLDVSVPMLSRAVRSHSAPNVGFLRADASRLPFRDGTITVITCVAALQLMPRPIEVIRQMVRVLAPGGRIAIMVPTLLGGSADPSNRYLGQFFDVHFFAERDIAGSLGHFGIQETISRRVGPVQWTVARKAS